MCGTHVSLADEHPVTIRRLGRNQIAQAFPLLREAGRCDSLASWEDYALAFMDDNRDAAWPSGVIAAEQFNRCIVGLYSYVVRPCLRAGRVLNIGDLTVMSPFGRDLVAERLLDSIAELASTYRVREFEIGLASASGWWAALLGKRGYTLDDRRQIVWRRGAAPAMAHATPVSAPAPLGS
jgi:hypothetical protein